MAKIIQKRDLIDEKALQEINRDAEQLLSTLQGINHTINGNLNSSKEYFLSFKAVDSKSIKQFNTELAKTNKLIEVKKQVTTQEIALQKQVEKSRLEEIKLQQQREKAFDNYEKKLQKASKAQEQALKKEQSELRKAQQEAIKKARADEKLNSVLEQTRIKHNNLSKALMELSLQGKEETRTFKALEQQFLKTDAALRKAEKTVGRSQRNVGNYPNVSNMLGGAAAVTGIGLGAAALGSFASDTVGEYKEFDKALKEVSAITGVTGKKLDELKEKSLEVGSSGRAGATEYLEAIKLIGSASPELLKDSTALKKFADDAITLKQAAGIDLPAAAEAVTAVRNQFELGATQSTRIINGLAAASLAGSSEVADLTESLKNSGTVAKESNVDFESTVSWLELLAKHQLKNAEAGTKFSGVILQLKKNQLGFGSGKFNLNDALAEARKKLDSIQDPAKRAALELKYFGKENQTAGLIMLKELKNFDAMKKSIVGTNTAFEQAATNQSSAAAQGEILSNKLQTLKIQIGEKLAPVFNLFKLALIGIMEVINAVLGVIGSLIGSIVDLVSNVLGITAAMEQARKITESFTYANQNLKKEMEGLNKQVEAGTMNAAEYVFAVHQMAENTKDLSKFTKGGADDIKALNEQLRQGTITAEQYYDASVKIRFRDAFRIDSQKAVDAATGAADVFLKTSDELAKAAALNKEQLDKAFQAEMNRLELRKTNAEIYTNDTISDEKKRTDALTEINIEYLSERAIIEKKYGKEYRKTVLENTQAEKADQKRKDDEAIAEINRQRELQKTIDKKKNEGTVDERTKEENSAFIEYLDNLDTVTGATQKDYDLRAQYYEDYKRKLKAIDDKYAADADELEAENAANEKKYMDYMDEKKAEQRKQELQQKFDFANKVLQMVENEVQRENQIKEQQINDEIARRQKSIDFNQQLAEKGAKNELLFQEKKLAEAQLAERKQKADEIKQQKVLAFFKSYTAYAEKDPSTAITKALRDLAATQFVQAAFIDGTENVGKDPQMQKNKVRPGTDGYLAFFDGDERILKPQHNKIIGDISNEELTSIIDSYNKGFLAPSDVAAPVSVMRAYSITDKLEHKLSETNEKLDRLVNETRNKPVVHSYQTESGVVKETYRNGMKTIEVINSKPSLVIGG